MASTTIIIQLQNLYAALNSRALGHHPLKTSLAVVNSEGQILSSTPLFDKIFGSYGTHTENLPFHTKTKSIKIQGLSKQKQDNLTKWAAETMIVPTDMSLHLSGIQRIHKTLTLLPNLKSIQALTNDRFVLIFNKELSETELRNIQGQILKSAGVYSLIGASSISYNQALTALELAKQNTNGRAVTNQPETIFQRSLDAIHHLFQTKSAA